MATCVPSVLDKGLDYHDKDDNVEEQDGKNGTKESTKEYCRIIDKTAGGKNEKKCVRLCCALLDISVMYCTLHLTINDSQSLNIWCGSAYKKISADYIRQV